MTVLSLNQQVRVTAQSNAKAGYSKFAKTLTGTVTKVNKSSFKVTTECGKVLTVASSRTINKDNYRKAIPAYELYLGKGGAYNYSVVAI